MIDKNMAVAPVPRPLLEHSCNVVKKAQKKAKHSPKAARTGRWTQEEKLLFLYGLSKFGKGRWKKIGTYLPTRSLVQIKSHGQKVMKRLEAGENVFAPLEENRDYFEHLVLPSRSVSKKAHVASEVLSVPHLVDEGTREHTMPKHRMQLPKKVYVNAGFPKRRLEEPRVPTPEMLPRRSVFQATLGNGNFSFSFGSRTPPMTPSSPPRISYHHTCTSPDPYGRTDSRTGAAIAAAALCQLSSLGGRKEIAAVVSP